MIMNTEFLQESQVSDKRYDQWSDELLFSFLFTYNAWNIFQLALIFVTKN